MLHLLSFQLLDLYSLPQSPPPLIPDPGPGQLPGKLGENANTIIATMKAVLLVLAAGAGLIGVGLKDVFESLFHGVRPVAFALLVTGSLLLATKWRSGGERTAADLTIGAALLIGIGQGMAITPGISRSGTTIALALFLGFHRELAARFSFLLSVPAIVGALVLLAKDGITVQGAHATPLLIGFLSSMVVGYLALVLLVQLVKRGNLHRFTWYVWPLAVVALVWSFAG